MPEMYLRAWLNDHGELAALDHQTRKVFMSGPAVMAKRNGYFTYQMTDGESDAWEKALATEFEGPAAPVLSRIIAGTWPIDENDRGILANFLAIQFARAPYLREMQDDAATQVMRMAGKMMATNRESLRASFREQHDREPSPDELDEVAQALSDDFTVKHHNNASFQFFEIASDFVQPFFDMNWTLVSAGGMHSFITSDQPLVLWRADGMPEWSGVGILTAKFITFPLGPKHCLRMEIEKKFRGDVVEFIRRGSDSQTVDDGEVDETNAKTEAHADRHTFFYVPHKIKDQFLRNVNDSLSSAQLPENT